MKQYIIHLSIDGKPQNVKQKDFVSRKDAWDAMFRWALKQTEVGLFLYRKKGFCLSGHDGYIKVTNGKRIYEYRLKTISEKKS